MNYLKSVVVTKCERTAYDRPFYVRVVQLLPMGSVTESSTLQPISGSFPCVIDAALTFLLFAAFSISYE